MAAAVEQADLPVSQSRLTNLWPKLRGR